jgi:hypothetical protein
MVTAMMPEYFVSVAYSETDSVISVWGCRCTQLGHQSFPCFILQYKVVIIELRHRDEF